MTIRVRPANTYRSDFFAEEDVKSEKNEVHEYLPDNPE